MDALVFMTDSIMDAKSEGISSANTKSSSVAANKVSSPSVQLEAQEEQKLTAQQPDTDVSTSVQRPVDLYKAIFSDDSDDEDDSGLNSAAEPERRSEGANRTLNRIIAGDFLESLGKELGLEIPMGPPHLDKVNSTCLTSPSNNKPTPALEPSSVTINNKEVKIHESMIAETIAINTVPNKSYTESVYTEEKRPNDSGSLRENMAVSFRTGADGRFSGHEENKADRKEQHRKHRNKSRREPSSSSDTDSSKGRGYHDRSRSAKKVSSKRKHRRQERHHKHKTSASPSRYSDDDSDSDPSDDHRRDRKSRDRRGHGRRDGGRKYH